MSVKTPHLKVPFNVADGSVALVEQDSDQEIRQCILAALSTRIGSRIEAPEYGTPDKSFEQLKPNLSADDYLAIVEALEPRAHLIGKVQVEEMIERILIKREADG